MAHLILASASPRRKELLLQAGYQFEVQASSVPEVRQPGEDATRFATRLARQKAEAIFALQQVGASCVVLGADTVVVCDQEVMGKPKDADDAVGMLQRLSGRTHAVVTGVAAVWAGAAGTQVESAAEVTWVTMHTLSAVEIRKYVDSGEPMDKAGAYGIQGYAARWIPRISGCYFNVVGLPLALVANLLEGIARRTAN
jgi:septum formation protein